jgi:hypothetical protein
VLEGLVAQEVSGPVGSLKKLRCLKSLSLWAGGLLDINQRADQKKVAALRAD